MSNKKIFKKLYFQKINKDDNYRVVLERIENNNRKSNIWKKKIVTVCSLIIICGIVLININEKKESFKSNEQIDDTNRNYNIYINNNNNSNSVNSYSSSENIYDVAYSKKINIDYNKLIQSTSYSFLINLDIPNDLDGRQYGEVYVKENENSDHILLQYYEFLYQNDSDRKIIISFSNKYENFKNESSKDNIKISKIDDTEVIIYQEGSLYKVTFNYNDINFNIKTNNIDEEELINLLKSIIK